MRAVPQYVYLFRRRFSVDGPGSQPVQTDVVVVRSSTEMLPHEVTQALAALADRPVGEYEQIEALPDVWLKFDTWDAELQMCFPERYQKDYVKVVPAVDIEPA